MNHLNENQQIAVTHKDGPMIVIAGPGSGKTTVIANRIAYLIDNLKIDSKKILVITFSKAATTEMDNKFKNLMDHKPNSVTFNTFHSLFFRIIRNYYNFDLQNIISEDEKKFIIKDIVFKENIIIDDSEDFLQTITNEISLVKNELIDIKFYDSINMSAQDFKTVFRIYEQKKLEKNKIDFDDMLSRCYNLLLSNDNILEQWQNRYDYILIDEFQDVNKVQYEVIKLLISPKYNIFIVGDDDQSIYKFRGARPEFLLNFPKEIKNVKEIILDINYRSTDSIIKLSNAIIKENKIRYNKIIKGTGQNGTLPKLIKVADIREESFYIANKIIELNKNINYDDIAVYI